MRTYGHAASKTRDTHALEPRVSVLDPMAREARECFEKQAHAISQLAGRLEDGAFGRAVQLLYGIEGHVIVTGIGKSGLVGQKIAATLASTGTPSFFLHATEAFHGDLGSVTRHDAMLVITYSGETEEITRLLPHLDARGIPTVALVGRADSTVARKSDVFLDVSVERELCPHNLAPTNSTLATLAMADALAVALMRTRGFHREDFARLHPGGNLGRRLLGRVRDNIQRRPLPVVSRDGTVADCVFALARTGLPVVLIMQNEGLCGIVHGDSLRKALDRDQRLERPLDELIESDVPIIEEDAPLVEAEDRMHRDGLDALVVLDERGRVSGVLTHHMGW
ncbi:MAG: KpsF/GutQ family sugar-phosphate isomerase [Myxococcota bacterium]